MSTLVEEKTKLVSMMQWQDVLVEPSDIQFCKDKEGKRILMGGGARCGGTHAGLLVAWREI